MTSYQIEGFQFLDGCIVFEDDLRTKWSVRLPPNGGAEAGPWADQIPAFDAIKERVVGRVVCRFKDGSPAFAALYLDVEGELHWTEPVAAGGDK